MFKKLLKLIKPAPKVTLQERKENFEKILLKHDLEPRRIEVRENKITFFYPGGRDAEIDLDKDCYTLDCAFYPGVNYLNYFGYTDEQEDIMLHIIKSSRYMS